MKNGPLDDAGKARVDVLRAALGLTAGVEVEAEASVQIVGVQCIGILLRCDAVGMLYDRLTTRL